MVLESCTLSWAWPILIYQFCLIFNFCQLNGQRVMHLGKFQSKFDQKLKITARPMSASPPISRIATSTTTRTMIIPRHLVAPTDGKSRALNRTSTTTTLFIPRPLHRQTEKIDNLTSTTTKTLIIPRSLVAPTDIKRWVCLSISLSRHWPPWPSPRSRRVCCWPSARFPAASSAFCTWIRSWTLSRSPDSHSGASARTSMLRERTSFPSPTLTRT